MADESLNELITRRDFLKLSAAGALSLALPGSELFGASPADAPDVWVFHGKDNYRLMQKAMETVFAGKSIGKNVALKVNAAWERTPEQGANTDPVLVDAFIAGVLESGTSKVVVPENPCLPAHKAFTKSGILQVVEKHKQQMIDLRSDRNYYRAVKLKDAVRLKEAEVAKDFLDSDVVVNMPVAKSHGASKLSMAMKNWMGAVYDRGFWHNNDLNQCIADFATFMKPTWTFVDATRTMMKGGPQGPGPMKHPHLLIVSRDQVAADAYAATLFFRSPYSVKYIRLAKEMNIGQTDIKKMNVHKIEVA
jgi:uncharacterized protein (DUF362 family)